MSDQTRDQDYYDTPPAEDLMAELSEAFAAVFDKVGPFTYTSGPTPERDPNALNQPIPGVDLDQLVDIGHIQTET